MKRWLLVLLLLLPLAAAQEPFTYDSLTVDGLIINPITIQALTTRATISSLDANISWYPRDLPGQDVLFFTTVPEGTVTDSGVLFSLRRPSPGDYSFDMEYQVKTYSDITPVTKKVRFPLPPLSSDLRVYLQETDTIDENDDIRRLAADLAAGEDDLFIVVAKIAAWTKEHIEYDLTTLSVEASQPSTWVLQNRQGVCDEMTNLFISFLRSLGVPARFVSGLSYTNSELFADPWGAHGWAEVYFPTVGWVPFDVTYGQLGWVDATHVVFSEGIDGGKYATSYEWMGRDMQVQALGMQLDADIAEYGHLLEPLLLVTVSAAGAEVGIGSYNVITATLSNPSKRYVADEVLIGHVEGYQLLDADRQVVVLAPGGRTSVYWRLRVDPLLDPGFLYTFPLVVQTMRGASGGASFVAATGKRMLSGQWADQYVENAAGEDSSTYALQVSLSCDVVGNALPRPGEPVDILCSLANNGQTSLKAVSLCMEAECTTLDVPVGGVAHRGFSPVFGAPSVYALSFSAVHSLFEKYAYVSVEVIDEPLVLIHNLSFPSSIDYAGEGVVHFEVSHLGGSPARSARVTLAGPRMQKSWSFDALSGTKVFDISVPGDALLSKGGSFSVEVSYLDERSVAHSLEEPFFIRMGEAAWYQELLLWIVTFFEGG